MQTSTAARSLVQNIVTGVDDIVREASELTRPLEIDPYRERLFELFVTAEGAGLLDEEADPRLSSDDVCHVLAERWGLADSARTWMENQTRLPADDMAQMRALWSVMRMWMEWTYAWRRWPEFHSSDDSSA